MIRQGAKKYPVTEAMLHTFAVPTGWHEGRSAQDMLLAVRSWHMARGWRKEGYHRIVAPNGEMAIGRSLYEIGAGCRGHNRGVIHIAMCNVTEVTRIGKFEDFYTRSQRVAVRDYLVELEELNGAPIKVTGHNQYSSKLCPGFKVVSDEWL